ncbi:MAG: hypothetical protein DME78_03435 [Verrucomicrobia bacterium]|nr:MAG: hypothetical protein DME78_03435 [Verrucomicrobiota bacterium]
MNRALFALLGTAAPPVLPEYFTGLFILVGTLADLNIVVKQWVIPTGGPSLLSMRTAVTERISSRALMIG